MIDDDWFSCHLSNTLGAPNTGILRLRNKSSNGDPFGYNLQQKTRFCEKQQSVNR